MSRLPSSPTADERGFILVGVVMFMIALTILGLSLFALSSYEAQFFYASQSREQALQSSEGGMELVKALLTDPTVPSTYRYRLEAARLAPGHFGVTRALAYQARSNDPNDTTSRGPVNWSSPVFIVVSAKAGGEERAVLNQFVNKSPYHDLLTAAQGVTFNASGFSSPTLQLSGAVWQPVASGVDSAWTDDVTWANGRPVDRGVPTAPGANAFVDAKLALASPPESQDIHFVADPTYWIAFDDAPVTAPFYVLPAHSSPLSGGDDPEFGDYEFYCNRKLELRIHGTAVWLLRGGACFGNTVTVVPDPDQQPDPNNPDVLVIVAKPNGSGANPNRGLWFEGGLVNDSTATRVFLVSDGDISFNQARHPSASFDAEAVSIAAGGSVEIMGPTGTQARVAHAGSMNALADAMVLSGTLPLPGGGTGSRFGFVQHSWLETRLP